MNQCLLTLLGRPWADSGCDTHAAIAALSIMMPLAEDSYIILNTTRRRGTAVHAIHVLPGKDERWSAAAIALVPGLESALNGQAKVAICMSSQHWTWLVTLAGSHNYSETRHAGIGIAGKLPN